MIKYLKIILVCLIVSVGTTASAEGLRVFVAPFTVIGSGLDKQETSMVLQSLLSARLSSENVLPVHAEADAQITLRGTLVALGSQYSLDVLILDADKKVIARKALTGSDKQIPLFSLSDSIAKSLVTELGKIPKVAKSDVKNNAQPNRSALLYKNRDTNKDIVYAKQSMTKEKLVAVPRMQGGFNLVRLLPDGKAMALTGSRNIKIIDLETRKSSTETQLEVGSQIINIDIVPEVSHAKTLLAVTYVHMNTVYTAIYEYAQAKLQPIALKEPFYARAVRLSGKTAKLYIQEQGSESERYYGDVYEASWDGKRLLKGRKVLLPRYGSLYNFNQFTDQSGEVLTIVYDDNGYLVVYDAASKPIWKSNDKFGGSELSYSIRDVANITKTGKEYRLFFMNQRVEVTDSQDLLVGYNDGTFVVGDSRTYKKGVVYNFAWNGSALEEVWRTKETQSYMPDFEYDPKTKTLYQLQLVQREDPFKGDAAMSSIIIKKVE